MDTKDSTQFPRRRKRHRDFTHLGLATTQQVKAIFHVNSTTITEWKKKGLKPLKQGKTHVYLVDEIVAILKKLREE